MAAIYVNGIKTSCMAIGGGGGISLPTNFWKGSQSDYDNLQSYDDNTLYYIEIHSADKDQSRIAHFTSKIYLGTNQIFPVQKDGYDFYIENFDCPNTVPGNSDNDYAINTGILLHTTENVNRPWQLEFKAELAQSPAVSTDHVIIGGWRDQSQIYEIYLNNSGNLCVYAAGISDSSKVTDANNHDIKMIRNGSSIEIYKDDVLSTTLTGFNPGTTSGSYVYPLMLNYYSRNENYRFHGTIHYLKFKWLPTT